MHIGLIGGIGPSATISYYSLLVKKFKAAGIPLRLTIVNADIGTLSNNAKENNRKAQAAVFLNHLQELKGAGCDVALITALTGHFCFYETQEVSPIHLLNGIEIIDNYCQGEGVKRLGLLGSSPVLTTHLFGMLEKVTTLVPETDLSELGSKYMELAHSGVCSESTRAEFIEVGASMVSDQGADAILLAGTDLGLAFNGQTLNYRTIDALELHVDVLLNMAMEQQ